MSEKFHEKVSGEELTDIVKLENGSGEIFEFNHIGTIEYNDEWFAFFQPANKLDGIDPASTVVFKIDDENGNEIFLPVKDEKLLDEVYNEFMRELEEGDDGCCGNCEGCHGCDGND